MSPTRTPAVQALLDVAGGSQRDHVLASQELRRSNAASPHGVRRPGDARVRGSRRQTRRAAIVASLRD
jgi:hypothetical protein